MFLKQRRSGWSGSHFGDQRGKDQSGPDTFCCNAEMDSSEDRESRQASYRSTAIFKQGIVGAPTQVAAE